MYTQGGQMKLIVLGSVEEQIAADAIEGGLGYRQATLLVNEYRAALPRPEGTAPPHNIFIGAVHGAMMRLKPVTTKVLISKQGSFDASSGWAMARHKWTLQLLVRFGEWTGLEAWLDLAKATQAAALLMLLPQQPLPHHHHLPMWPLPPPPPRRQTLI